MIVILTGGRYEWINKFRDRSVTELEILHGFLLHPSLPTGHTFFYFRDPNYLTTLDDDSRNKYVYFRLIYCRYYYFLIVLKGFKIQHRTLLHTWIH